MGRKLETMSEVLQELAAQKKDVEYLRGTQREHREWLKGHEARMQELEKVQQACNIKDLSKDVKVLRYAPGVVAMRFLYAVLLLVIGSGVAWVVKG